MWVAQKDLSADKISKSVMVGGDQFVPRTTRWNEWYLIWRGWNTVAILDVGAFHGSFRVGFITSDGVVKLGPRVSGAIQFAALVGHEDVRFFAIDEKECFLDLNMRRRVTRREYRSSYKANAPLI